MSDDEDPLVTFERISGGWLMRDRDGGVRSPVPLPAAQVRAYGRLLHVPVPAEVEQDRP